MDLFTYGKKGHDDEEVDENKAKSTHYCYRNGQVFVNDGSINKSKRKKLQKKNQRLFSNKCPPKGKDQIYLTENKLCIKSDQFIIAFTMCCCSSTFDYYFIYRMEFHTIAYTYVHMHK